MFVWYNSACERCVQMHRACNKSIPCDSCVRHGEVHLCKRSNFRKRGRPPSAIRQQEKSEEDANVYFEKVKKQRPDSIHNQQHSNSPTPLAQNATVANQTPPPKNDVAGVKSA